MSRYGHALELVTRWCRCGKPADTFEDGHASCAGCALAEVRASA